MEKTAKRVDFRSQSIVRRNKSSLQWGMTPLSNGSSSVTSSQPGQWSLWIPCIDQNFNSSNWLPYISFNVSTKNLVAHQDGMCTYLRLWLQTKAVILLLPISQQNTRVSKYFVSNTAETQCQFILLLISSNVLKGPYHTSAHVRQFDFWS